MGFVFFFVFSLLLELDTLRNVKAVMIFLISIKYIHEKKIMRYMALNFLGVLFHASAIIYLPLYFILNIRFNKALIFWLWVFGNAIFLTQFNWMREILYNTIDYSFGRYSSLLRRYQDVGEQGISIGYIERSLSFILLFLFQNKLEKKGNVSNVFINVMYIYIFIHLYFFEMDVIVKRFSLLFLCGYWIIYPNIYRIIPKQKKCIFLFLMILYGALRLGYNNAFIERRYENVLLPHQSRQQRESIYRYKLDK
jgi:hypothetical protein